VTRISSGAPWEDRYGYSRAQVSGFAHPDHLIEVEIDAYRRP
jgi:hypothetical protein